MKRRMRGDGTNAGPVAAHLGIDLSEYDERIRTWIPAYDWMLDVLAMTLAGAATAHCATAAC